MENEVNPQSIPPSLPGANMDEWWYEANGEHKGPFEKKEIRTLVINGILRKNSLIWKQGWSTWLAVGETELATNFSDNIPPPIAVNTNSDSMKSAVSNMVLTFPIVSLICWILPVVGFPVSIIGIIQSRKSQKAGNKGIADTALGLSIIGLVLTIINSAYGAYKGYTGHLFK